MGKEMEKLIEDMRKVGESFDRALLLLDCIEQKSEIIKRESEIISRMLKFIEIPIEEAGKNVIFFEDFDILSAFLDNNKYNDLEIYKIIKFLITKNVAMGLDRADGIIDCRKVINFPFKDVTKNEILDFMSEEKISYMRSNYENLTGKEKSFYEQLIASIEELKLDELDQVQMANILLNDYFTEMENEYTLEDIEIAVENLRTLKVSKELAQIVKRVMTKKYNKRKNKTILTPSKDKHIYSTTTDKKYLTDAEYKVLLKKVKEIYDVYNVKLKREVNLEEMMEVVSAMVQMGYEESQVNQFVRLARASIEDDKVEIKTFIENYDRYLYYLSEEEVKDLIDYLEQMMITSDEDYLFWKVSFLEEVEKVNQKIKYKHGYEYQKYKNID